MMMASACQSLNFWAPDLDGTGGGGKGPLPSPTPVMHQQPAFKPGGFIDGVY